MKAAVHALKSERLKQGLTLGSLAARTGLTTGLLRDLENGRFSRVGPPDVIEACLKVYREALQSDPDAMAGPMAEPSSLPPGPLPAEQPGCPQTPESSAARNPARVLVGSVLVIAVIVVGAWYGWMQLGRHPKASVTPASLAKSSRLASFKTVPRDVGQRHSMPLRHKVLEKPVPPPAATASRPSKEPQPSSASSPPPQMAASRRHAPQPQPKVALQENSSGGGQAPPVSPRRVQAAPVPARKAAAPKIQEPPPASPQSVVTPASAQLSPAAAGIGKTESGQRLPAFTEQPAAAAMASAANAASLQTSPQPSKAASASKPPAAAPPGSAAATPAAHAGTAPQQNAASPAASDTHTLVLRATQKCWVQLKEANGIPPTGVLLQPGQSRRWQVTTPATLLVGNAGGLHAVWDGKPLNLPDKSGKVLHVSLPPA